LSQSLKFDDGIGILQNELGLSSRFTACLEYNIINLGDKLKDYTCFTVGTSYNNLVRWQYWSHFISAEL